VNWLALVLLFASAAALSALAVSASIRIAIRVGALDHPDSARKLQDRPIPRLGGVAVAVSFGIVALIYLVASGQPRNALLAASLLLPALGMAILGYVDDRRNVSPFARLSFQALAAGAAWFMGTTVALTGIPFFDLLIFVVWVVVIINGINLLDNSDGLAGSTVMIAALGATIIAVFGGQELVSVLGVSLAGVALGFLWHNWAPARVYLGDSGAYFLGFLVAVLAVRLRPESLSVPWSLLIPVLLLALPLLDTAFVVTRRLLAGVHPFTAGRDHLSHVLQGSGLGTAGSVIALQAMSVAGAVGAILVSVAK
jgi:UDP-GlcNAc:undecaprenyl-phosphate GlcNAc-1-phosphate transferase